MTEMNKNNTQETVDTVVSDNKDCADNVDSLSVNKDESGSAKTNIGEKITEASEKIGAKLEEIKNSEAVQNLKEKSKETFEKVKEFSESEEVKEAIENSKKFAKDTAVKAVEAAKDAKEKFTEFAEKNDLEGKIGKAAEETKGFLTNLFHKVVSFFNKDKGGKK